MHFSDSETQRLLRDTARSYMAANFGWERLYAIESGEQPLSRGDVQEFAKLGWLSLLVAEDSGGGGASLIDAAAVIEEFGYAAVPAPVAGNNIVASVLAAAPRSPISDEHLGKLTTGEGIYTLAEAARGRSDAGAPLAAKDGALSGTLPLVPFAELADFVLTPLTLDGDLALALLPTADAAHLESSR